MLKLLFSKKARKARKAAKEQKRRFAIEQRFNYLAEILPAEVKKARQEKRPSQVYLVQGLERYGEATSFAGYQRLHKMCAAADIAIEKKTLITGSLSLPQIHAYIAINFDRPYSASPDAPKKPRYKQLKLF